jgi:hypothetical protein
MRVSDPDNTLFDELAALPPRLRNAVLGALTVEERAALDVLRFGSAQGGGVDATASNDSGAISPWLAAQVQRAREGGGGMAPAARQALLRSVDGQGGPAPDARIAMADPAGRSLIGAMGGILSPRRRP